MLIILNSCRENHGREQVDMERGREGTVRNRAPHSDTADRVNRPKSGAWVHGPENWE